MEKAERRIFGALLLLLGVSFLTIGIYTDQLNTILEMLRNMFP